MTIVLISHDLKGTMEVVPESVKNESMLLKEFQNNCTLRGMHATYQRWWEVGDYILHGRERC